MGATKTELMRKAREQQAIRYIKVIIEERGILISPLLDKHMDDAIRSLIEHLRNLAAIDDSRLNSLSGDDIPF